MKRVIKRVVTILISLTVFAIWYPSLPFPGVGETVVALIWTLVVTVVPAGLVWVGTVRSRNLEIAGWCLQACSVALTLIH